MIVYLDNIIFNLQSSGVESFSWARLIRGLLPRHDVKLRFVEYHNAIANKERYRLNLARHGHLYIMRHKWLTRHLAVRIDGYKTPFIFHSSSLRVCDDPNAINIATINDNFKPSLRQLWRLKRFDGIICTSRTAMQLLPAELQAKSTIISTKKSNENIALLTVKFYRKTMAATTYIASSPDK